MDRRTLLKSIPVIAAIPLAIDGTEASAHELTPGKNYLFVFRRGENIQRLIPSLRRLGVSGSVITVMDPDDFKIYEVQK